MHIFNSQQQDILDVSDFQLATGSNAQNGTWTVQNPITTAQLQIGRYAVTVDATDAGGGAVTGASGFTYNFVVEQEVTIATTTTTLDYDHQSATFTGQVTGLQPDGAISNMPNVPVSIVDDLGHTVATTTSQSDGTYSVTVARANSGMAALVTKTTTADGWQSNPVSFTITTDQTQVTAVIKPSYVKYGQPAAVTGVLTYRSGSTWKPLANMDVTLTNTQQQVTTDATGRYSIPLNTTTSTSETEVIYASLSDYPFLNESVATAQLTVNMPVKVVSFNPTLNSFGYLEARGCLRLTGGTAPPPGGTVTVQYATSPKGPWKALGKVGVNGGASGTCHAAGESSFKAKVLTPVRLASAYYRADYTGNAGYQDAVSGAVLRWKYPTKITSFTVSPTHAPRHSRVTVRGRLWSKQKSWRGLARQKVMIIVRHNGVWYRYKHELRTSSSGRFSGRFTVYFPAPWAALYVGNRTHFASGSRKVRVRAAPTRGAAWDASGLIRISGPGVAAASPFSAAVPRWAYAR